MCKSDNQKSFVKVINLYDKLLNKYERYKCFDINEKFENFKICSINLNTDKLQFIDINEKKRKIIDEVFNIILDKTSFVESLPYFEIIKLLDTSFDKYYLPMIAFQDEYYGYLRIINPNNDRILSIYRLISKVLNMYHVDIIAKLGVEYGHDLLELFNSFRIDEIDKYFENLNNDIKLYNEFTIYFCLFLLPYYIKRLIDKYSSEFKSFYKITILHNNKYSNYSILNYAIVLEFNIDIEKFILKNNKYNEHSLYKKCIKFLENKE